MNALKYCSALILSVFALANTAQAGSFDVTSFWASGTNWIASYDANLTTESSRISIVHDKIAKMVTFNFTGNENQNLGGCQVGFNSTDEGRSLIAVYEKAVEVAENKARLSLLHVRSWQGICYDLSRVEYRTDLKVVEVVCDKGTTQWGQSVYVVGNTEMLGKWNPAKAIKLEPLFYPQWIGKVTVENNTNIEWKCIKRNEQNASLNLVWMSGANRTFFSGNTDAVWASF